MAAKALQSPASAFQPDPDGQLNLAVVVGEVAGQPAVRQLPDGTTVLSFAVRVRSSGRSPISVPVALHNPSSRQLSLTDEASVVVVGAVVRRFFRRNGMTQSRTEVLADRVELSRRKATCRRYLQQASDDLEAAILEAFL